MEKNLCRIPQDLFNILGTRLGAKIRVESVSKEQEENFFTLKMISIRAFEITQEMTKHRKKLQQSDNSRYINSEKIIKVLPDIPQIWIDAHIRYLLDVDSLGVVKVRRNITDLFFREFREFGITSFISLFTIVQVIPVKPTWMLLIPIILLALIFSLFLTLISIRSRLN
jgi:hypothetical protein